MSRDGHVSDGRTFGEVLRMGEERLAESGVPEAKANAWYLFAYCFDLDRARFFLCRDERADAVCQKKYESALARRASRVPLEHIIHTAEFMGLSFYVDEHVLIPRQDTECLVEEVLRFSSGKRVLDLCTGSGCIGISLSLLGDCGSVLASDISLDALAVAKRNASEHGAAITFVESDLFRQISGTFDIIVSNPPYIPTGEIDALMPEVRDHDPRSALDGEADGLGFYRRIAADAPEHLVPGGMLCLEIGCSQGEDVKRLLESAGFTGIRIKQDLAGLDRIVTGVLPPI